MNGCRMLCPTIFNGTVNALKAGFQVLFTALPTSSHLSIAYLVSDAVRLMAGFDSVMIPLIKESLVLCVNGVLVNDNDCFGH
jgi:hypothetical protein